MQLSIFSTFIIAVIPVCLAQKMLTDCLKPWQKTVMSVATITAPSAPLRCHPESNPCPNTGKNTECQFSFRSFMYVCCEDRDDVRAPICPKYHDTLNTFCGGTRATCPRGYKCLKSRYDPNIQLCCRPNKKMQHPEPETSFVDLEVTPLIIQKAPKGLLQVSYGGKNFTIGQLISNDDMDYLDEEPQLYAEVFKNNKLYTVLMFDMTRDDQPMILWLMPDVSSFNGRLMLEEKRKNGIAYQRPSGDEPPRGTHVVVVVVFEQNDNWTDKELKRIALEDNGNVKEWIRSSTKISKEPVAGTLFGFTSSSAERAGSEEDDSAASFL